MNTVFAFILLSSLVALICINPTQILPTMLLGGEKAISLCLTLLPTYALWLGFFSLVEASGLGQKLAKILFLPIKKLFGKVDKETNTLISLNISANLLGMSGIATPLGISACNNLDKQNNLKGVSTLFILSCTGLCLLPTSVISLRAKFLSNNPYDIIIPTFLSSIVFAFVGLFLVKIFIKNEDI
ncbi:MAG: hypothetical protein J6C97_01355 [Clostridia bacterium]|nr:hypothetical protein [Clostridia bacterium]